MRINTNLSALNAYRNLNVTDNRLNQSLERLSSGLRINRAADDAAGLAISEKMRGQIRGLNQATRNAQDGISLMQTAEGALNETHSILQRMRELAVQAASDTLTSSDRIEIQREIEQLRSEIDRIATSTEFNTKKLLDGSSAALTSTSDINTKVFMRGGLRTIDQFGQKAVGGGNYELEISARAGRGEVQKTDIMKIKHGDSQLQVEDPQPGQAKAFFTGIDNSIDEDDTLTMQFVIDGKQYEVVYEAGGDGEGPADIAEAINDKLGHLLTAYVDGDEDDLDWVDELDEGQLLLVLNGHSTKDQTQFDFWISDVDGITLGDLPDTQTSYVAEDSFISSVDVADAANMLKGDYSIDLKYHDADIQTDADDDDIGDAVFSQYIQKEGVNSLFDDEGHVEAGAEQNKNISLLFEVKGFSYDDHGDRDGVEVSYRYVVTNATNGEVIAESEGSRKNLGYKNDGNEEDSAISFGGFEFETLNFGGDDVFENWTVGDKMVINAQSVESGSGLHEITINRDNNKAVQYAFTDDAFENGDPYTLSFFQLDKDSGEFVKSKVAVNFHEDAWGGGVLGLDENDGNDELKEAASFTIGMSEGVGQLASRNSAIYNIDRFWDANGNFLVEDPQTINLVAGDGKSTSITIFGSDTIADIEQKLNRAIHKDLRQGDFNSDSESYVKFVDDSNVQEKGNFTVKGTFVIQSAVTGKDGDIRFSGNEGIINALSLTTLQESVENEFTVTVRNAHDPTEVIAENERIVGNKLVGVVHENVDVKFDPMAGITVRPDEEGAFEWNESDEPRKIFIHLSDNTMVFHIGANPLQDVGAAIGDMSSEALGIDNMLLTNRESANRALNQIDYAIERVSSERAKLGAVQNRLEHTINNLTVSAENLSAAESRVRDLDFAMEMVEFTRNQIMMQAGTSMLAQANQKPQSVLMLLQ